MKKEIGKLRRKRLNKTYKKEIKKVNRQLSILTQICRETQQKVDKALEAPKLTEDTFTCIQTTPSGMSHISAKRTTTPQNRSSKTASLLKTGSLIVSSLMSEEEPARDEEQMPGVSPLIDYTSTPAPPQVNPQLPSYSLSFPASSNSIFTQIQSPIYPQFYNAAPNFPCASNTLAIQQRCQNAIPRHYSPETQEQIKKMIMTVKERSTFLKLLMNTLFTTQALLDNTFTGANNTKKFDENLVGFIKTILFMRFPPTTEEGDRVKPWNTLTKKFLENRRQQRARDKRKDKLTAN